ncbi:glutaredoxin [Candidatus Fermentibacteria bacterium]|nr:MAG: glutaredoxin [Candidatus Fermentibacteria bacterium]
MALLSENDREAIREHFTALEKTVKVELIRKPGPCETENILKELSELSDKLNIQVTETDREEMLPLVKIGSTERVLFRGTPAGYEFSSLLTGIIDAGRDKITLTGETMNFLDSLEENLHIKVFVTPSCPHCPPAVVLAHRMATYSEKVTAEAIEANEFQEMAARYQVQGVPRTVINETFASEGAQPESYLIEALKKHLEKK